MQQKVCLCPTLFLYKKITLVGVIGLLFFYFELRFSGVEKSQVMAYKVLNRP